MPFQTASVSVRTRDGRNVILISPLVYISEAGERIEIPPGSDSDGASVPAAAWAGIPPFGDYWMPALLHDMLYRHTTRPREECDKLFLEAMESEGVPVVTRNIIYAAVRAGGQRAFEGSRKNVPTV